MVQRSHNEPAARRKRGKTEKTDWRDRWWLAPGGLFALTLLAYANSLGLGLAGDSQFLLTQDPRLQSATAHNLWLILTKTYWWPIAADLIYRPVTSASLLFNHALAGAAGGAFWYHAVNLLLHAFNVWLVWKLATRLLSPRAAWCAAALFAVHPIATEAVDNVVGRADLLAAMAVLAGLLIYGRATAQSGPRRWLGLFAVATVGVFSKENAAVLAALMLLSDLAFGVPGGLRARQRVAAYAAALGSVAALLVARAVVLAPLPWPPVFYMDNVLRDLPRWERLFSAQKIIGLDLCLLLWPLRLVSDRSFDAIRPAAWTDAAAWVSAWALLALLVLALAMRWRRPLVFWLAGFTGLALLPTSNLAVVIASPMAERFLYLPSVAFAIGAAALAWRYLSPRQAWAALGLLALLYTGRTWARNADWHDNLTLGLADVETAPRSARLHDMLGKAWYDRDPHANLDRAIAEQEKAWKLVRGLDPEQSSELIPAHLGIYYAERSSLAPEAERRAWREKSIAVLLEARKISLAAEQAFDNAQVEHNRPLVSRQAFVLLYLYLADDYLSLGRFSEALDALRYARILSPRFPPLYEAMAAAYRGLGDARGEAVARAGQALAEGRTPDAAQYCAAAGELAQALRDNRTPDATFELNLLAPCGSPGGGPR
ncbi:MAG: glycosyltransferase family 39 protein [Bryobacteraceae bacterium]|jgi:tetratricopeptide (TPR) repeat protein